MSNMIFFGNTKHVISWPDITNLIIHLTQKRGKNFHLY